MEYFKFVPLNKVVSFEGIVDVKLFYDIPADYINNVRLRPVVSSGTAFIYDAINAKWISPFDVTTNLPVISGDVKVKILNTVGDKVSLSFDVIDMKQQKTVKTPAVELLNHSIVTKEIQKYNLGIMRESTQSRQTTESTTSEEYFEYQPLPPSGQSDKNFMIIAAVFFLAFIVIGILYQLRMVKWVNAKEKS